VEERFLASLGMTDVAELCERGRRIVGAACIVEQRDACLRQAKIGAFGISMAY